MPERRDRSVDVHMRDGVLRKGKALAHSDSRGRIREADTPLRKGQELGVLDEKDRVRRRGGLLRRGEVLGRIRGNAIYVGEGLLGPGLKVGYVDETGQVWQTECSSFRGRVVGRARGADPEAALAYFILKFAELDDAVKVLEQKIGESEDRYAFLPRVRAMQRVLPEVDALGDFDALVRRLDALEETCASDLGQHIQASRDAIDEAVKHKPTPESILESLRNEWGLAGIVPDQADVIVGRARAAFSALNDVRKAALGELPVPEERRTPTIPPPPPTPSAPPVERDERTRRVEQVLEATLGSVERVREEIDRMRHDPDYRAEDLVDRVRVAMSSALEAGERIVAERAGIPARRDERPSHRPLPSSGSDHGTRGPIAPSASSPGSRGPIAPSASSPGSRGPIAPSTSSPGARSPLASASTPTTSPRAPLSGVATSPSIPIASSPTPSTSTALVHVETAEPSESRAFVEELMKTQEAEQVFEILDLGIERLRELEVVRRVGAGTLRKALDAMRKVQSRR